MSIFHFVMWVCYYVMPICYFVMWIYHFVMSFCHFVIWVYHHVCRFFISLCEFHFVIMLCLHYDLWLYHCFMAICFYFISVRHFVGFAILLCQCCISLCRFTSTRPYPTYILPNILTWPNMFPPFQTRPNPTYLPYPAVPYHTGWDWTGVTEGRVGYGYGMG